MKVTESIGLMEPMLPPVGERKREDLAMDYYYSNLIEGHDTYPRDIDRALMQADYSADLQKRALQHEAVAHIEVQRLIDHHEDLEGESTSQDYIVWLHRGFCERLPDEFLLVQNPDTGELLRVIPGELRKGWIQVGRHIPPNAEDLPRFLNRFTEA